MIGSEVFAKRRRALASGVDHPILIAAGSPSPRNYEANVDDFRASSHFLYTVGRSLEGAFLLLEEDRATLFAHLAGPEDRLWHGDTPGREALAALTGCDVRPLSDLAGAIPRGTATIPAVRKRTQLHQEQLLGRSLSEQTAGDRQLTMAMIELRLIHDEGAIDGLTRAATATQTGHLSGMKATRVGELEAVVKAAIEAPLIAQNYRTAYHSIVTVHGEVLHNHHHHHTMAEGDLLLVDAGAETDDGWAGDVTRTWPVNGKFSSTQRLIYEVVLRAQEAALEQVRPKERYRDIHLTACRALTQGWWI